jgi:hypothetical protein
MTLYELLLFLHVACVILWLGSGTTLALVGVYGRQRRDQALLERLGPIGNWLGPRVFGPAALGALGSGLWLVERGSWTYDPLWIRLGLGAYGITLVTNFAIRVPLSRQLSQGRGDGRRLGQLLGNLALFELTVLFLTVADMVAKPTSDDAGTLIVGGAVLAVVATLAATPAFRPATARRT